MGPIFLEKNRLDSKKIVELGCGYGGQSIILGDLLEIEDRNYDCKKVNLLENSIINLGKKLLDADRLVLGIRFFKHAAETLLDEERKCLIVFLDRISNLSGIIAISNKFKIKSDLILKYSFPLINNLDTNQIDNLQLVYSIIRQESGFYSLSLIHI